MKKSTTDKAKNISRLEFYGKESSVRTKFCMDSELIYDLANTLELHSPYCHALLFFVCTCLLLAVF